MADDYEDVEQLYLYANRLLEEEQRLNVQFPCVLVRVQFPLRDVMEEITDLIREGYVEEKYSNDEAFAPLRP